MRRSARNRRSRKGRRGIRSKLPGAEITVHRRFLFAIGKTAADTGRVLSTTLNDYSASELQSVFQLYKISKIKATWTLVNAPNNNANFPTLHLAPQNFTFITPASLTEMLQYDKLKIFQFGPNRVQYSHTFTPACLLEASASAGTGQVIMPGGVPFLSTNNINSNFIFGSYWLARYSNVDVTHTVELTLDATIKLKGTR